MRYAWCGSTDARSQNHPAWQSQCLRTSKHGQTSEPEHYEKCEDGEDETFLFGK